MDIQNEVLRLLSQEGCGVLPREQIETECALLDIGFDSLRYMEFVVLLEESLHITVPDSMLEIRAEMKVADIIRMASEAGHA
ncbi:acyl carrier protein [Xylanibacillus composti]|uniref:Carrier domain-containing protein n=1 Tax=Xylanibacillus composti TaxID=1572762 RepID=A0A8J4H6E3_9BACL|nr:acyl carrier protein [Xylanibacillus composti]MDT9726735.1 acyl carrier protein [Xylanibacillus composti]GIQ69333.1 hypothetical protein XYCOK13_21570 [Xylanibacillus composti]